MAIGLPPLPPFLPPPPFFFASIRAGGPLRAYSDACSEALGAMRRAVQEQQHQQRRTAERSMPTACCAISRSRSFAPWWRRVYGCDVAPGERHFRQRCAGRLDASQSGLSARVAYVAERLLGVASAAPQQPQRALSYVLVPRVDEGA